MNDSKFHYVDDPTVEVASDGTIAVAWVDNQSQNVLVQTFDEQGDPLLDEPVDVSRTPDTFSWLPQIVVTGTEAGEHNIYVLWQEIVFSGGTHGGEIFFSRSSNGGESFSSPVNLSKTKNGAGKGRITEEIWHNGSLDIAIGPDGVLYAAWTEYQGPLRVRRSTNDGESFSPPTRIAGTNSTPARGPSLAVAPDGTVYLAWTVGEDDDADIRIARSTNGAKSFEAPTVPFDTEGHSDAPKVAVDSAGRLHLAFGESPNGAFERYHVRYARSSADQLAFDSSRRISEPTPETLRGTNFPALSIDGEDRIYVVWERYPTQSRHPRGLGFTVSRDAGDAFTEPSLIPGTGDPDLGINGSLQGQLMQKLSVNDAGSIAVVNSRFLEGQSSRIRLIRGGFSKTP